MVCILQLILLVWPSLARIGTIWMKLQRQQISSSIWSNRLSSSSMYSSSWGHNNSNNRRWVHREVAVDTLVAVPIIIARLQRQSSIIIEGVPRVPSSSTSPVKLTMAPLLTTSLVIIISSNSRISCAHITRTMPQVRMTRHGARQKRSHWSIFNSSVPIALIPTQTPRPTWLTVVRGASHRP